MAGQLASSNSGKKSGLIELKQGEILFNDNDQAESLYIIQKGQIRLFKPKGQGFIEIGVLRSGEVLGEMAFFDETGRKRSCSASAIVATEIIEISFAAFSKAIENLNPWFKTIITTLADRLRKTNVKVKELETNSVTGGYGEKAREYKFFQNIEVIKILSMCFLVFRSHGAENSEGLELHVNTLKFYAEDIFNIQEVKLEEFLEILKNLDYLESKKDKNGQFKLLILKKISEIRSLLIFLNAERNTPDDKRMIISTKTELLLAEILKVIEKSNIQTEECIVELTPIYNKFKEEKMIIGSEEINEAMEYSLLEEPLLDKQNKLTTKVDLQKLKSVYPAIRMINAVKTANDKKNKKSYS